MFVVKSFQPRTAILLAVLYVDKAPSVLVVKVSFGYLSQFQLSFVFRLLIKPVWFFDFSY